jgi:hypothetical protein
VVRAGFGFFYDLGYGNIGDASTSYPYLRDEFNILPSPVPFDLSDPVFQPIPFSATVTANQGGLFFIDPNLQLPLTIQWNGAIERELGTNQRLTATYVGADARRLLREDRIAPQGPFNDPSYPAVSNGGYAHYEALQLQFQRRMSHGLQALVSYNFSKASDTGSNDGTGFRGAERQPNRRLTTNPFRLRPEALRCRSRVLRSTSPCLGASGQCDPERLGSGCVGQGKFGAPAHCVRWKSEFHRWISPSAG